MTAPMFRVSKNDIYSSEYKSLISNIPVARYLVGLEFFPEI